MSQAKELFDVNCKICGSLIGRYPSGWTGPCVCKSPRCAREYDWWRMTPKDRIKRAVSCGVGEFFIRNEKLPTLDAFGAKLVKPLNLDDSHYVCGPVGTGKSWLLACLVCEQLAAGREPQLFNWQWLRIQIRSTYGKSNGGGGETEYSLLKYYSKIEFLCLDDLGSGKESDAERDLLYTLLDYRYTHNLITNLSSNMTPAELSDRYDARIARRITEICKIVVLT